MNKYFFIFYALPSGINDDGTCVINSWKKSVGVYAVTSLIGAFLFLVVSNRFLNYANEMSLFKYAIIILPIVFIVNLSSVYFTLRKNRLEMDSSCLTVYLAKNTHSIDWRDVSDITISPQKRSGFTRQGEYYKITYEDKMGYPFNDILAEKTPELEMDIARYYKKGNEGF